MFSSCEIDKCTSRKALESNCSKNARDGQVLGEALGLGQLLDEFFRKKAVKDRPAIEVGQVVRKLSITYDCACPTGGGRPLICKLTPAS